MPTKQAQELYELYLGCFQIKNVNPLFIRPCQCYLFQDTSEADYIAAIRRNDLETVKKLLNERDEFNYDVVGADGKFAVQIALENENVGMYKFS